MATTSLIAGSTLEPSVLFLVLAMGPKLLQKRISNLHHKLLVNRLRAAENRQHEPSHGKTTVDRRWDTNYTWNVDDDEEIPGTVRIVLSTSDPQKTKNQVVYSIPDRCFIPAATASNAIEIFDQPSWSVYLEPVASTEILGNQPVCDNRIDLDVTSEDDSEAFDPDRSIDNILNNQVNLNGSINAQHTTLDTSRSDPNTTERDEDHAEPLGTIKVVKRKGAKGINHFSYCDRATQTTVPPIRSHTVQTEAPSRVSFCSMINSWIIFDAYRQDIVAQQQKVQQQQALMNNAGDSANKSGVATSSVTSSAPAVAEPSAAASTITGAGVASTSSAAASAFLMQPAGESALSPAGVTRLDSSARVIERMLNQNTYDDIAQDFRYWEDAADEYREPEGTLMPLWRFAPPAALLRMFEENGSMRNQVPSHVTSICWHPHYKELFAMGLGARDNISPESGLVCVFSLKSPTQPERSAQLPAGVSSLDFHREFWQLLAVGMHDGHVAVIDLTVRRDSETFKITNLIVYRSSALRGKRTVPVTQVSWHGDTGDGNLRLFSISMDGCLCSWLYVHGELYPTELITMPFMGDNKLDPSLSSLPLSASCSCMSIHPNNSMVLVGTDQGQLWPVTNEGEILTWGPINAHQGPVYTVQWNLFHPQVFITCGTDWLVKIWDQREKDALVILNLGSCVEDCAFSPFSATAFACMSANGKVSVYDLNACLHKPLCSQRVAPQRRSQPTKLAFAPFHPVVLVGDDKGHATCLKLSPNLRKISRVPESSRQADVEIEKLERIITLMKR